MASRKLFLYGLGTGLIAASLILRLADIGQSASEQAADEPSSRANALTIEQLRSAAEENGYILHDASLTWYTEEELQSRLAESASQQQEVATVYAFTIASGTELGTIARMLFDMGLIKDPNHFIEQMEERGLAGKVQAKYYRFDGMPSLEKLIAGLISP